MSFVSNNYWAPQNNEFLNQVVAISIQGIIKRMLVIIHLQQAHHRVIYSQGIIRYAFFLHIRNKQKKLIRTHVRGAVTVIIREGFPTTMHLIYFRYKRGGKKLGYSFHKVWGLEAKKNNGYRFKLSVFLPVYVRQFPEYSSRKLTLEPRRGHLK